MSISSEIFTARIPITAGVCMGEGWVDVNATLDCNKSKLVSSSIISVRTESPDSVLYIDGGLWEPYHDHVTSFSQPAEHVVDDVTGTAHLTYSTNPITRRLFVNELRTKVEKR